MTGAAARVGGLRTPAGTRPPDGPAALLVVGGCSAGAAVPPSACPVALGRCAQRDDRLLAEGGVLCYSIDICGYIDAGRKEPTTRENCGASREGPE